MLVEFFRANYKEPARSGLSKRHTTTSETFSGDAVETEFTVSNTDLLCINTVTISAVAQVKYQDYDIDLVNNKIVFKSAPASGSDNIAVNYDYNTSTKSWIYVSEARPRTKLVRTDFPLVTVAPITGSSSFMGFNSDKNLSEQTFQVDIVTREKLVATDYVVVKNDGTTTTVSESVQGNKLAQLIARNLWNALQFNWRTDLIGIMWCPVNSLIDIRRIPFEEDKEIFRYAIDFRLRGFDLGVVRA